jgi:hypothetical protein
MKQLLILAIAFTISMAVCAQTVKRLENQKDAWGLTYTFTGEVKNGKPNGMGIAKYASGNVLRYAGNFVNGMYNGKGTMLFTDGAFLTGNWVNGKLSGKGANLTSGGTLYIGDFVNGEKNGQGILMYKDNSFTKGGFKDDKFNGRCINLWTDGNIISDIIYVNDKRNGTGYQYEAKSKATYEGEWKDDKWVQATTASFTSFLKAPAFIGEITDAHVLIGPVNSRNFLIDTSYYYDLAKHKRYFGYYVNGNLRNGIIMKDDSTRFMGELNEKGATGYCYDFKFNKYYSEGNYINDYLNGEILDIDLAKKTIYYGGAIQGQFTGKAYFFNDKGTMYAGDYVKGRLNGQGYRLESSGHLTIGTWVDGLTKNVTSITTTKGDIIPGKPKTFLESLNIVIRDYAEYFDNLIGAASDDLSYDDWLATPTDKDAYYDYYNSLVPFFGSTRPDVIADDLDVTNLYIVTLFQGADEARAKAKYNETIKQLTAATINNSVLGKPTKLKGSAVVPDMSKSVNATRFDLDTDASIYSPFHVWVKLRKEINGGYAVSLELGEQNDTQ